MKKSLYIAIATVLLILVGVLTLALTKDQANAQPIPDSSYFKDVKALSKGTKPACLKNNSSAQVAADKLTPTNYSYSFGLALGTRILDMPAGMFDSTVNSFANNQAKGTITFSDKNQAAFVGDLQRFNYVATVDPSNNHWKLTRLIACQD